MRAARAIGLVLAALAACRDGGTGSGTAPAQGSAPPQAAAEPTWQPPPAPRTTGGAIAAQNLDAQIRGAEQLAQARPGEASHKVRLVEHLLDRASFLGRFADLERALALAEEVVKAAADRPEVYVTRARARAALHRFEDALADLDKAQALGAKPAEIEAARAGVLEGLGRLDEALPLRRRAREARASLRSLAAEAALLGDMGQLDEAERRFGEALAAYRDVSPFAVAWVRFQHGLMWERAGELERARQLYADAHARLPLYAHAAAHLAAIEPPSRAVAILDPIARSSDDPQHMAQLAEARRLAGAGDGAPELAQARRRFEELEKLHPAAVADHASWFWLGPGRDPARAAALAQANANARRTAAAYELLVEALRQAGRRDEACAAADEGLRLRYPSPKLKDAARRALAACGRPAPSR